MNAFLKRFRLTFTVEGPVFIGSGEKRTAKEYVDGERSVYFPDMGRLYDDLVERGKDSSFENFRLNRGIRNDRDSQRSGAQRLDGWMKQNGLWPPVPKVLGGYGMRKGDLVEQRARNDRQGRLGSREPQKLNDIHTFIKDAFGQPYIPGSSIKGLLRTMFLEDRLLRQRSGTPGVITIPADKRGAEEAARQIEARYLRGLKRDEKHPADAVNDNFQAIRISDSGPLSTANLVICQKVDGSVRGEISGLPLHRECLKPGTAFTVDVTVDVGVWPQGAAFVQHLSQVAQSINDVRYMPHVNKYEIDGLKAAKPGPYVYLGGGAGFRSKTFVNDQTAMSRVLDNQFRQIHHVEKTRQLGVSPLALKLTKVDGVLYEMGKCRLTVEPRPAE